MVPGLWWEGLALSAAACGPCCLFCLRGLLNAKMKDTLLPGKFFETAPPKKGDLLSIGLMQTGQLQELGFSLFIQLEDVYIFFFLQQFTKM